MSVRCRFFPGMVVGLLTAIGACAAFSQTAAPVPVRPVPVKPVPRPGDEQQSQQKRPEVFFPMAEQPEMEMHHHGQIQEVMPEFPRLGDSQSVVTGPIYELKDLEKMAEEHNPTLAQAQREIEAARGRKLQAGLYPNPTVGYKGDEIRGGSYGGGEQGFFVQQPIILGGKLALDSKVREAEEKERGVEADAQRQRVENDVRMAYYRVLAAQERLALKRSILGISQSTVRIVRQLGRVGQADETEILEAEAEEQRMEIAVGIAEQMLRREWTTLVSVVGVPSLPAGGVAGRIDADLPPLDQDQLLASLLAESPTIRSARANLERDEASLQRAKREPIPDLIVQGGLQQNLESLSVPQNRKVGLQGFAEVGVQLRLWDRNQGAIRAEGAGVEAAREEVRRVELELRNRFAMYGEDYGSSRLIADKYRVEILPRLERAYKLMVEQYGLMTASFIRVLILERMLYENETAYVDALEHTWTSSIALRGFLLDGSLGSQTSRSSGPANGGGDTLPPMGEGNRMIGSPSGLGMK
jgi:cobalt-zinc-cadmium efflux system outer membrane protein